MRDNETTNTLEEQKRISKAPKLSIVSKSLATGIASATRSEEQWKASTCYSSYRQNCFFLGSLYIRHSTFVRLLFEALALVIHDCTERGGVLRR